MHPPPIRMFVKRSNREPFARSSIKIAPFAPVCPPPDRTTEFFKRSGFSPLGPDCPVADQLESLRRVCDRDPASVEADAGERKSPRHLIGWSYRQGGWRGHIVQGTGSASSTTRSSTLSGPLPAKHSASRRDHRRDHQSHVRRLTATSSSSDSSGVTAAGAVVGAAAGVVDAAAAGSPRAEDG